MVRTIICEIGTIIYDIGIINVRFYLLEVRYPYGYCRITPCLTKTKREKIKIIIVINATLQY